jgi:hypothetical protein
VSPKPKSLIPDAMVVICLHELGLWESFCRRVTVIVPSIVVHESVFYRDGATGKHARIDLEAQVLAGDIQQESATLAEMDEFRRQFDAVMVENLHDGEIESLTLLSLGRVVGCVLCSADRAAVKALALVGMKDKGISLERAFHELGMPGARRLEPQYSEERFAQWLAEALVDRMQGRGLARRPF